MSTHGTCAEAKKRRERPLIDAIETRQPTPEQFADMLLCLDRLGPEFFEALAAAVGENCGRRGTVTARQVIAAWLLSAFEKDHKAHVAAATRQLLACSDEQLAQLGMERLPVNRAYARFYDKTRAVMAAIKRGFCYTRNGKRIYICPATFVNLMLNTTIPVDAVLTQTFAVDGTDWEAGASFVRTDKVAEYEGAVPVDTDTPLADHEKHVKGVRTLWRDLVPIGDDGRPIYTTDVDARAGHRSANCTRKAGLYIGYELHVAIQVPNFDYRGKPTQVSIGPRVPGYVRYAKLSAAGAHRSREVVPGLIETLTADRDRILAGNPSADVDLTVIWDRGYSILAWEDTAGALAAAGIGTVFDLAKNQHGVKGKLTRLVWIDGTPFHADMPKQLYILPGFAMGDSTEVRQRKQAKFDERARWRYTPIGRTENGKGTRYQCPFCAGRLRYSGQRITKANHDAPLVELPKGRTKCCGGTVSIPDGANQLAQARNLIFGTTAWRTVYCQRPLVENLFHLAKNQYGDLDRGYTRLRGLQDHEFALAFYLTAVNRSIARSEASKTAARAQDQASADTSSDTRGTDGDDSSNGGRSPRVPTQRTAQTKVRGPKPAPRQPSTGIPRRT